MTNEAAERLPERIFQLGIAGTAGPKWKRQSDEWVAEALAAERRATVERIRKRLERIAADLPGEDFRGVYAILDEEAK